MRTPVDAFHQQLLQLVEQKRREERRKNRPRMATGYPGERVVFTPGHFMVAAVCGLWLGATGRVVDSNGDHILVRVDGEALPIQTLTLHWTQEQPLQIDSIDDIERWLAS